jgi:hypothetical protein
VDIAEVAVNQCGSTPERRVAFVDINGECFIALINTYGATRRCEKIGYYQYNSSFYAFFSRCNDIQHPF